MMHRWSHWSLLLAMLSTTLQAFTLDYTSNGTTLEIKVGLLIPLNTPMLMPLMGYRTTAAAMTIALDRIEREQLLPHVNFTIEWLYEECNEVTSVGYVIEMFENRHVDVIFGPTCSLPATMAAILATFYSLPMFIFGLVTASVLSDPIRYPTVNIAQSDSNSVALSLTRILKTYGWNQVAVIYSTDAHLLKCEYIIQDLEDQAWLSIVYEKHVRATSSQDLASTLRQIRKLARIVIGCLNSPTEKRRLMLAMFDEGITTSDYVFILVDQNGVGFGNPPFYVDTAESKDGRDNDAMQAARITFTFDAEVNDDPEVEQFRHEVIERMADWPFYCTELCNVTQEQNASSSAPYLHDVMYMYALSLNRTLTQFGPDAVRNGEIIAANCVGNFSGMSGSVRINDWGNRDGIFSFTGMNADNEIVAFTNVETNSNYTVAVKLYSDAATSIWSTRDGYCPPAVPKCGFSGSECPEDFFRTAFGYIIAVAAILIIVIVLSIAIVCYVCRLRRQEIKLLDSQWQIPFLLLQKPDEKASEMSRPSLSNASMHLGSGSVASASDVLYLHNDVVIAVAHKDAPLLYKADHAELRQMRQFRHDNVNRFVGLSLDGPCCLSIWKFCSRGSIEHIISSKPISMDAFFITSLISDIVNGVQAIHRSFLHHHGHLTSAKCLVDERWQVKITDYGLRRIREFQPPVNDCQTNWYWTAPEHLRTYSANGSREGDVYAIAIIASELINGSPAWRATDHDVDPEELLFRVKQGRNPPVRPPVSPPANVVLNSRLLDLVHDCWSEEPSNRPNIDTVRLTLGSMNKTRHRNLMDHVFEIMEEYAGTLEDVVQERVKELNEEKVKSDTLLYRLLPKEAAEKLRQGENVPPEVYTHATLFFSDVVSFTTLASSCTPLQVVNLLNALYSVFDSTIEAHDVYKVETIGDGYLCASGLPQRNGDRHASEVADMALELVTKIESFKVPHLPEYKLNLRIGLHTGACVTGVVGLTMPRYCLFGETVSTAARMESNGKPGQIHISKETNEFLTNIFGGYETHPRGEILVKGKGMMQTFWLLGKANGPLLKAPE